jgi:hypothetical protein
MSRPESGITSWRSRLPLEEMLIEKNLKKEFHLTLSPLIKGEGTVIQILKKISKD